MAVTSAHPQGPFDQFIALMNHEAAKDLVRNINLFMKGFKQSAPDADADSRAVQGFLQQMETAMAKHPLFADTTPQEQDAATEALEKYLMTKLHERTFRRGADDVERDEALAVRCVALGFVRPEHLEIPPGVVDDTHLGRAVEELNKINKYKAPRDKLVCVLNCCSMINAQLAKSSKEGIGADDFTPLLIFVVIKAATPYLASNLAYIERYRYHPKLTAEAQYYYIQLCGAATFIEMINAQSLKVDRDEFIAHMLAAGAMSDEQLASLQSHNSADMAPPAAAADRQAAASSATQQNIHRSTQAAVAAATAAGIRVDDSQQQQQQQQFPLQMQPLPTVNSPASGWPQAALGHSSPGWPYQQQQQQHGRPPSPPQQRHPQQQEQQQPPQLLLPSVAELESQGAALLSQRDPSAAARQLVSRHPFCCSELDSLSLGDVGQLLASYKELVLRHEALMAALEDWRQQQQNAGTAPPAAAATTGAAGPPPPIAAPDGDVLTPPTSTGGAEPMVLAPLSPAAPEPASPAPAAAAAGMSEQLQQQQAQAQQQQVSPSLPATAPGSQDVVPSSSAAAAAALEAAPPASPPPAAAATAAAPPPPPPAALQAGSAPSGIAGAASAATGQATGVADAQQQDSNVDDLLQSLLSPSAAQPANIPTAMSEPPPQQQQQQQVQQEAAEGDDLFGLFQGRSSDSGGGSNTAGAGAPSLLD